MDQQLGRLNSIDFLRGVTIAFMIVVNTPGNGEHVFAPLRHSAWNGCTPTDLVFPTFLFLVGVSFWLSFEKMGGQPSRSVWLKIARRTALLFLIGVLMYWFPFVDVHPFSFRPMGEIRVFGVLQRIALSYGLAASLCLLLKNRHLPFALVGLMLLYWALLLFCGQPGLDPLSLEGNAVRRLDLFLLGENHLYHNYTDALGQPVAFDPEGLLGTLGGAATALIGILTAQHIRRRGSQLDLLDRDLLLFGLGMVAAASLWHLFLPINKPLWTPSYALFAGGISMVGLGLSIWMLDLRRWRAGAGPFIIMGRNALFVYLFSEILNPFMSLFSWTSPEGSVETPLGWAYKHLFVPIDGAELGSLLYAVCFMGICFLAGWVLYRRNIFWKI